MSEAINIVTFLKSLRASNDLGTTFATVQVEWAAHTRDKDVHRVLSILTFLVYIICTT